jgi:hypothetical protein
MSPIYKDTYERLGEPPASDRHASRAETIEQANDGFNVELTFVVLVIFYCLRHAVRRASQEIGVDRWTPAQYIPNSWACPGGT